MGTKNLNSATNLITFTRASGGTALRKISYGNELVTNGTFDTDISGWTSYNSVISWDAGLLKVNDSADAGGGSQAYQVVTLEVGKRYRLTGSYENSTASRLWIDNSSSNVSPNSPTADLIQVLLPATTPSVDFAHTFVATATTTSIALVVDLTGTGYFDNISVKEVLFDQADGTLQLFNHGNNVPRIEYDADGTVKGLLIEQARTNLVTYSNDFTTSSWTRQLVSIASNVSGVTAPDGSETVDKMIPNSSNNEHRVWDGVSSTAVGETYSVYAKSAGYDYVWLGYYEGSVYGYAVVNLTNGVVTASNTANYNYSVEASTNGFYRISVTKTASGTNPRYISISPSPTASPTLNSNNVPVYTGDGTSGIYVYGAQIEAGAFPTSYIPTTGSTATRAADVATIPTSAFGYNSGAGSVVVEAETINTSGTNHADLRIKTSDGFVVTDSGSRVGGYAAGSYVVYSSKTSVSMKIDSVITGGQTYKTAYTLKDNDAALSVDGSSAIADASTNFSGSPAFIFEIGKGYNYLNGHIKSIQYYPRRLTNAQLQELTT